MSSRVIFWDFDGTLAARPRMFRSSLKMVLDEFEKGHQVAEEDFIQWMEGNYPWDNHERDYLPLRTPDAWWDSMCRVFEKAYVMNGIEPEKACRYAREARKHLVAPERYNLFEDTLDTLEYLKEKGYRNIILSNHIPELPEIARHMGLMEHMDFCISSANVGYEKPNPGIYRYALELAGNPDEVWMVGDNINADVRGAEAVGIRGILVRKPTEEKVRYFSPGLKGTIRLITGDAG